MIERTLVLVKPDGVERGLVGEIVSRLERAGLKVVGLKMVRMDRDMARRHYEAHVDKPFYKALEEFIVSGPVVAAAVEGIHAVEIVRKLVGPTEPRKAHPGTIRWDYSSHSTDWTAPRGQVVRNLIHASGDAADARRELTLWFRDSEILDYPRCSDAHVR